MITALISTLAGLVSGSAPSLLKEFTASREHGRELAMLTQQTTMQLQIAQTQSAGKVAEIDRQIDISAYENQAKVAVASLKPIGVGWVDAWNGMLRPFAVTGIIILFLAMASFYTYAVLSAVESLDQATVAIQLLWGSLIGEAIQAVLGFLFGYRSARK